MTLVSITRTIHNTALSIPRDFASRATHTSNAMFNAKTQSGTTMKNIPQPPHAAQPAAGFRSLGAAKAAGKQVTPVRIIRTPATKSIFLPIDMLPSHSYSVDISPRPLKRILAATGTCWFFPQCFSSQMFVG